MSRVADKIAMIARRATKVAAVTRYCVAADCGSSRLLPFPRQRFAPRVLAAAGTTMPRSATPRAHDFVATRMGTGFVGGLLCCARCEGGGGCDTLPRSGRLREQPPACPARTGRLRRTVSGLRPFAASRALHSIPQNHVRGHVGLNQRFLKHV